MKSHPRLPEMQRNPGLRWDGGFFTEDRRRITILPPVCRKIITRNSASAGTDANALIARQNRPESAKAGFGHL
jgi:hypothetical protein